MKLDYNLGEAVTEELGSGNWQVLIKDKHCQLVIATCNDWETADVICQALNNARLG